MQKNVVIVDALNNNNIQQQRNSFEWSLKNTFHTVTTQGFIFRGGKSGRMQV